MIECNFKNVLTLTVVKRLAQRRGDTIHDIFWNEILLNILNIVFVVPFKSSYEERRKLARNVLWGTKHLPLNCLAKKWWHPPSFLINLFNVSTKTWKFVNTKTIKTSVLMESNWKFHLGFDLWICPLNLSHPPIILGKRERWRWSCKQVFKNQATKSRES